ncbi:hypothetical protein F2P81_010163 [Scophthalmus maximus]|uniref:ABC transporter domain-containing protein n=1 Tax=Scophthalmus maximus TaxID=52904 RepID=A0A6A4SX46_SCOMX|nr:hypothetical protein F2P81_010163 [Scophthalmus maximus]
MERANHVHIAMVEDIGTNGVACSKAVTSTEPDKQPCGSTVSFHNIQYQVEELKSGFCKRKSSSKEILVDLKFLDILAARKDPCGLSGEVLIDGAPQPPNFKCLSGYVVQEDVVMGTLTVRENLRFSAALRLPSSVPQNEKEARVNHLIKELGLTKVADSKVGTEMSRGISGGERKRTNIGMELIIDPSVLFLDEPTTGLDASTANSVLLLLKRMASHGRTIILSIHQPRYSIYRLFDTLTLLVSGKMVFHGPAPKALDYFANIGYPCEPHNNPADFFLDVINGDFTGTTMTKVHSSEDLDSEELSSSRQSIEERLIEEYRNCSYSGDTRAELDRIVQDKECVLRPKSRTITYNSSFFHQLRWVLKRTFQNLMLNPQTSVAQLGVNIFLALIVGAIFFGIKDDQSGIQNRHEYISGYYRVSVYFLSKILSDITLRTITSVIFSCTVYFMIVTLVAYTATAMTMAISADQSVVALANIFMTITFVFMMNQGRVINRFIEGIKFKNVNKHMSNNVNEMCRSTFIDLVVYLQALKINEFVGLTFCEEAVIRNANMSAKLTNCSVNTAGLTCTGEQYLDYLGIEYTTWGLWENHVALTVMSVIFLIIAYLKLRYIKKFT